MCKVIKLRRRVKRTTFWKAKRRWGGSGQLSRFGDSQRALRSGDRMPARVRFSAPVQTGPGAHPASYTMGTGSLPREVKRTGQGFDHLRQSSTEVKERVQLYLYPSGPSWLVVHGFDHLLQSSTEVEERVELYLYPSGPSWLVLG